MEIFCFGDSITYGGEHSWVQKLRKEVNCEPGEDSDVVYNLGVPGDTSREVLQRFEKEIKARKTEDTETLILLQVGINDSQIVKEKNDNKIQKEEFRQNLEKLYFRAREYTDLIYFLGLTPVVNSKTNPVDWDNNKKYSNDQVRRYEDVLYSFCREKDINFIELYDRFLENGYGELLRDGVHPNRKGHLLIKETVGEKLRAEGLIPTKELR